MLDIIIGILIPFIGTSLGAFCVFSRLYNDDDT